MKITFSDIINSLRRIQELDGKRPGDIIFTTKAWQCATVHMLDSPGNPSCGYFMGLRFRVVESADDIPEMLEFVRAQYPGAQVLVVSL